MKEYLLTAGPTPVPERVLLAMARPMLYHRAPAFTECLREVQDSLRWLMQTKQLPLIISGSGTAGMDAAVSNFLRAGDKVIVVAYGQLDASEARNYAPNVVLLDDGNRIKSAA